MMLKKLFETKKTFIIIIVLLLVILGVIIGVSVNKGSKDADRNNPVSGTENDGSGLEIKEDNGEEEDSSDASGSWDDEPSNNNSDVQGGNQEGSGTEIGDGNEGNGTENGDNEEVPDEDTLIDDKIWGDIF